jgi:hypothetical protein
MKKKYWLKLSFGELERDSCNINTKSGSHWLKRPNRHPPKNLAFQFLKVPRLASLWMLIDQLNKAALCIEANLEKFRDLLLAPELVYAGCM